MYYRINSFIAIICILYFMRTIIKDNIIHNVWLIIVKQILLIKKKIWYRNRTVLIKP